MPGGEALAALSSGGSVCGGGGDDGDVGGDDDGGPGWCLGEIGFERGELVGSMMASKWRAEVIWMESRRMKW